MGSFEAAVVKVSSLMLSSPAPLREQFSPIMSRESKAKLLQQHSTGAYDAPENLSVTGLTLDFYGSPILQRALLRAKSSTIDLDGSCCGGNEVMLASSSPTLSFGLASSLVRDSSVSLLEYAEKAVLMQQGCGSSNVLLPAAESPASESKGGCSGLC